MGYNVIICEKPSVSREYAKVLKINQSDKKDGYIEGRSGADGKDYRITWAVGHLIGMCYPEKYDENLKKWRMETLPFLPETYKYEVIRAVKDQYKVVKTVFHMGDTETIYYAGDSGREGIYIQMLIREQAGHKSGVDEKVVWIDSQTEDEIKRGLREAKPISHYQNLIDAGYMRAIEDFAIGINFSRALTCKFGYEYNKKLNTDKGSRKPIAVGRVMTCVLGMIVNREREIRNFKETLFYKPVASVLDFEAAWKAVEGTAYYNSAEVYDNKGFLRKDDADGFVTKLSQNPSLTVTSAEVRAEKKYAPLLYNLAEIQADSTRLLKLSPKDTLDIIQALYEKKMVTYPRTDARVLSSAVAKEIETQLKGLSRGGYKSDVATKILSGGKYKGLENTKYTDDKKITDHYAIIPTGEGDYDSLKGTHKEIYELIVKRFLSIFYPPAEYKEAKVELIHSDNEHFFASEKILKVQGYLEVLEEGDIKDDTKMMSLKKGDQLDASFSVSEGKTQPPKRYTSGSMILAMENAGNLIEEEELREQIKSCGIGTSATRAETINKLEKDGYIALNKKTQVLSPLTAGELLVDIVEANIPALLSPRNTASWEKGLSQIENGEIGRNVYLEKLNSYITKEVESIREKEAMEQPKFVSEELDLRCPWCGGSIVTTPLGFKCSNYSKEDEDGCKFYIGQVAKRQISKEELTDLLQSGRTGLLTGFHGKKGAFDAHLVLDQDEKNIKFAFLEMKAEATGLTCPWCGGEVVTAKNGFKCQNFSKEEDNGCRFYVGQIAKRDISKNELTELLQNGKTKVLKGFQGKKGKFDAALTLDRNEKTIKFEFADQNEETDFECPKCGERLSKTAFSLKCSCGFSVYYSIAGKKLNDNQIKSLLAGRTGVIKGFKSKAGKSFDAAVQMDENGKTSFIFPDKK